LSLSTLFLFEIGAFWRGQRNETRRDGDEASGDVDPTQTISASWSSPAGGLGPGRRFSFI
jgi:hypothetical protein